MKFIARLLMLSFLFAGTTFAQEQSEIKIYIESWDRISLPEHDSDWSSKEEAGKFLDTKDKSTTVIEIMLGKNLSISKKGLESEIDEIQTWLVSLGFKTITFKCAASFREPPVVRRYTKGEIFKP